MEKMEQKVNEILAYLNKESTKMNDTYWKRSDAWRESDKGEAYEQVTSALDDAIAALEELSSAITDLQSV